MPKLKHYCNTTAKYPEFQIVFYMSKDYEISEIPNVKFDPDYITKKLRLKPKWTYHHRIRPKQAIVQNAHSDWWYYTKIYKGWDFEREFDKLCKRIQKREKEILHIQEIFEPTYTDFMVVTYQFNDYMPVISLSKESIKFMARINATFSEDHYSSTRNPKNYELIHWGDGTSTRVFKDK